MRSSTLLIVAAWVFFCFDGGAFQSSEESESINFCDPDIMAVYQFTLETRWTEKRFPKDYPRNTAQWARVFGLSHNNVYNLYKIGEMLQYELRNYTKSGSTRYLQEMAAQNENIFDSFEADSITRGSGKTSAIFFVDGDSSLVSFMSRMEPSPDWFVGVDGFDLCAESTWLESVVLGLQPMDAGVMEGQSFEDKRWPTHPVDPVVPLGQIFPIQPLSPFYYPRRKELPEIAIVTFTKLKEYSKDHLWKAMLTHIRQKYERQIFQPYPGMYIDDAVEVRTLANKAPNTISNGRTTLKGAGKLLFRDENNLMNHDIRDNVIHHLRRGQLPYTPSYVIDTRGRRSQIIGRRRLSRDYFKNGNNQIKFGNGNEMTSNDEDLLEGIIPSMDDGDVMNFLEESDGNYKDGVYRPRNDETDTVEVITIPTNEVDYSEEVDNPSQLLSGMKPLKKFSKQTFASVKDSNYDKSRVNDFSSKILGIEYATKKKITGVKLQPIVQNKVETKAFFNKYDDKHKKKNGNVGIEYKPVNIKTVEHRSTDLEPEDEYLGNKNVGIEYKNNENQIGVEYKTDNEIILSVAGGKKFGRGEHLPRHFKHRLAEAVNEDKKVDCVVSNWSEWSKCTKTDNGRRTRHRYIVIPPTLNGAQCPELFEEEICFIDRENEAYFGWRKF